MLKLYKRLFGKKEAIKNSSLTIRVKYRNEELPKIHVFDFKARREALGLSLREVEKISGIPTSTINQLENNQKVNYTYCVVMSVHNFYLQEESKINGSK